MNETINFILKNFSITHISSCFKNHFEAMRLFNNLFNKIKVGDFVKEIRLITQRDVDKFSHISGDHNPIHKQDFSDKTDTPPIVHGAFLNAIVSGIIGSKLPGFGTLVLSQEFSFPQKCLIDEEIQILVEILEARKIIKVRYEVTQNNQAVFKGTANLLMTK